MRVFRTGSWFTSRTFGFPPPFSKRKAIISLLLPLSRKRPTKVSRLTRNGQRSFLFNPARGRLRPEARGTGAEGNGRSSLRCNRKRCDDGARFRRGGHSVPASAPDVRGRN